MPKIESKLSNSEPKFFPSSIGIGSGVAREGGKVVDSLIDMGDYGFIELGPCTIDPQH